MIRIAIALLAILFLLFLVSGVFGRVCALTVWDGPFWAKYKAPIIVVGVIGALVTFLVLLRVGERRRLENKQTYARERGWEFSTDDTLGIRARTEAVYYDRTFESPSCIRTVQVGLPTIYLFDCWHRHCKAAASVRPNRATVCLIESERFRSILDPFVITQYIVMGETLIGEEVVLDESPFSSQFVVYGTSPNAVRVDLNQTIQSAILEYKAKEPHDFLAVAIGPSGAVLRIQETLDHQRWQNLIDLARKIESAVG